MDQHPHIVNFQIRFFSPRHNEFRWISATETPRYKEDGSYAGCIGAAVDITDFKRAQEAIQDYTKRLEQSNKDLEQFATIASHDLQAPLRKIAMFSSYIQETSYNALTNESKDYFDRILKSVEKMQRLLKDLLDLSRVTRKGQPFRPVRLNTIVDEVISDLQFLMLETNGRLEVDELCTVQADPLQMHQLFPHLLGTALKFHQPHLPPLVKIYLEESRDAYCSIVVEDNGIGFKEEQAERIFEPFVRLNGAEAYEGTGMGLTICKKIVERHGGRISITSRLGEGTRVLIRLLKADTTNGTH